MELNTGLGQDPRHKLAEGLSRLLAETYALYLKTQNFHWNVSGAEFFELHILFEKQYEELAEAVDEIAERIRALGLFVDATLSNFQKLSTIKDESKLLIARDMVAALVDGNETICRHARHLAELAEASKDQATVDLLARRLGVHEKAAWFLRSHI